MLDFSINTVTLLYLVASVCFIQALKGLSHPTTSIRGNVFGMVGMLIATISTFGLIGNMANVLGTDSLLSGVILVALGIALGGGIGATMAKKVEMTKMPELVAFMHSMVGLAAVFIAIAAVIEPHALNITEKGMQIPAGNRLELFLGAAIGAITFSGSVIAFGKLSGKYKFRLFQGAPIVFSGQHLINLIVGLSIIALGVIFTLTENWAAFFLLLALSFIVGVLIIIPIGGADMPVVVSMLNSYSGWAAAGIGFSLGNSMLIVAGSLVGSSGAILSYIMCKAMNRAFLSVILGGFGGETDLAQSSGESKPIKTGSADDAAFMLGNADSVIIVPGYGLAVAQAQKICKEIQETLEKNEVEVKYAIHPVAGRMPGHMNVLLAEADVDYSKLIELDEANEKFNSTDVTIVVGANDVVNPDAIDDSSSPLFGMPILKVWESKNVVVLKRSMNPGYAGVQNPLFFKDNSKMYFGDAKDSLQRLSSELKNL